MPWSTRDTMSLRDEFVTLARQDGANRRELCRRFGISAQTCYKWLDRFERYGAAGLADVSRRPKSMPSITPSPLAEAVVALRLEHPAWGGRKIARRLQDLGFGEIAPSTVTTVLHRHGLISPEASASAQPWRRFEHEHPNALWQIDFKGLIKTTAGGCHPLTLLDDHSRFSLAIRACAREEKELVHNHLVRVFRTYGLPARINADNGPPWGSPREPGQLSALALWLVRLGIRVSYSRPYHPQTNGKEERFHRSFKAEVLKGRIFADLPHAQREFERWRHVYNEQRPHEALDLATPSSRYRMSERGYPERLPPIEYGPDDIVSTVRWGGSVRFKKKYFKVAKGLQGLPVALRPVPKRDGLFEVYFVHQKLGEIDLRES